MKVLIVGAGPTGMTAALEFARQGILPEVVDAKNEPSRLSRAIGILPNSINILNRTGVGQKIADEGIKFSQIEIMRDSSPLIKLDLSKVLKEEELPISLPQDRTETLMSESLSEMGVQIKYNTRVTNIQNAKNKAVVTFANGGEKEYDWVVGADGVWSTVRKSLGIEYQGYELEEDWSIADIYLCDKKDAKFQAWLLKAPYKERDIMLMVPIGPRRVRVVSSTPDSLKNLPVNIDIKEIKRSGSFKISIRQAERYVVGHVLLAGDAAHAHSPVGGRGMNLGIDDAQAAVKAILNNETNKYEKERKEIARSIIRGTEKVRKALVSRNPFISLAIKILAWGIQNIEFIRTKVLSRIANLI